MRLAVIVILVCLAGAGCVGQSGNASKHSHWYRLAYARCAKDMQPTEARRHIVRVLVMTPTMAHHLKDFDAGCSAAGKDASRAYFLRYGWLGQP